MKISNDTPTRPLAPWRELALVYLASLLVFLPFFFFFFRLIAFSTVPMDDYENFILNWDGKAPANFQFYSPQGYRWAFTGAGYFFYKALPLIELTNLGTSEMARIQAFQALALTSFIFAHLYFFMNYCLVRLRLGKPVDASLSIAFIVFFLGLSSNIYSVDAITLAWTSLALFCVDKLKWYAAIVLLSVFVNEKIPLLFAAYFSLIALFDRQQAGWQPRLGVALLAVCIYFAERWLLAFPGYEYQTQPGQFFERVRVSIPFLTSFKGLYMNFLPLILQLGISFWVWKKRLFGFGYFQSKAIIGLPVVFFGLGIFACSNYGIGRICLHSLPFFAVPLALLMEKFEHKDDLAET